MMVFDKSCPIFSAVLCPGRILFINGLGDVEPMLINFIKQLITNYNRWTPVWVIFIIGRPTISTQLYCISDSFFYFDLDFLTHNSDCLLCMASASFFFNKRRKIELKSTAFACRHFLKSLF